MNENAVMLLIPLAVIAGGVVIVAMGLFQRTRVLEMAHRERLAMIERGLTPPPPEHPEMRGEGPRAVTSARSRRSMSLGILMIGLGLGLGVLIAFAAGVPDTAVGIGGAIVVLGAALVVNALVLDRAGPGPTPPLP